MPELDCPKCGQPALQLEGSNSLIPTHTKTLVNVWVGRDGGTNTKVEPKSSFPKALHGGAVNTMASCARCGAAGLIHVVQGDNSLELELRNWKDAP